MFSVRSCVRHVRLVNFGYTLCVRATSDLIGLFSVVHSARRAYFVANIHTLYIKKSRFENKLFWSVLKQMDLLRGGVKVEYRIIPNAEFT